MPVFDLQKARQIAAANGQSDQHIQAYLVQHPELTVTGANTPQPQQSGGGITDWLPTLGSIVGGVGGGIIGNAPGAIAGGAFGGGAGEWLRQTISGQQPDVGNIAKETAFGGVGGALGPVAKGAGALVRGGARAALLSGAEKTALAAVEKGAGKVATGATGNVVERLGQNLGIRSLRLQPSQLTKFAARHGEDVTQFLSNEGAIGKGVKALESQHIQPLQQEFNAIAKQSGLTAQPIDFGKNIEEQVQTLLQAGGSENAALAGQIRKEAQYLAEHDLIPNNFDIAKIDSLRSNFANKVNWNDPAKATVDYALADALRKTAIDTANNAGLPGLKEIGIRLSKFRDLNKFATAQANLGRGSMPMGITKWLSVMGGGAASGMGGVPGAAMGLATNAVVNSPEALGLAARGLTKIGGSKALQTGADIAGKTVNQTATQVGTRGVINQIQPQQAEAAGPTSDFSSPTDTNTSTSSMSDFSTPENSQKVKQAFALAMMANPKQAATLKTIYDFGFAPQGAGANVGKVTAKDYALAKSGLRTVKDVRQMYNEDPNVLTKQLIPGQFASRKFDSAVYDAFDTLLRLRTGAQANPDEIRGYMRKIGPTFGDSPDVVKYKLSKLEADLEYYSKGGSADSSNSVSDFSSVGQ